MPCFGLFGSGSTVRRLGFVPNSLAQIAYTTVDRMGRKAGDSVAGWVVTSDDAVMSQGLGEFLARSVAGQWTESRQGTHLQCELIGDADELDELAWPMARALAQYLLIYHERDWLDDLLHRRYHIFDADEQCTILDHALRILHQDQDQDLSRMDLAAAVIFNYLVHQPTLVVEGVRTFLMSDIKVEFDEAIDQAVDTHLMEQEYQEFVHLLRQLVNVAGTRQEWIHVHFDQRRRFYFEDPSGLRLADELIDDILDGADVELGGLDDVLISALVTLAPERITIHQGNLAKEGQETLLQVFDGRVLFCRGCSRCYAAHVDRDWRSF